jgi:hypothetical protein
MSPSVSAEVAEALVSPFAEADTEVPAQFVVADTAAAEVIVASTAQLLL